MRIGFFVWEYPPSFVGGLGTYAENITQEFLDIGHDVSVFTLNRGGLKTRDILSATKCINGLIKKEKYNFDVVCVHDWLSSVSGLVIKNETKIPVVFHTHSTEWGRSGGQGSEVVSHLEAAMAQNANRIITVSYAMQQDLIKHGWPQSKISVVWNGVDPERYNPRKCEQEDIEKTREKYGVPKDWNMLLFVGRLAWVKGVRNLLQAMPTVL